MWHIRSLEQKSTRPLLAIPKLQIIAQQNSRHDHLNHMRRKPPARARVPPEPKLYLRLAGSYKLVPDLGARLRAPVCLLAELVETQAVEGVWVRVEVGVEGDGVRGR